MKILILISMISLPWFAFVSCSTCDIWTGDKDTAYVFDKKWGNINESGINDGIYVESKDSTGGYVSIFNCNQDTCYFVSRRDFIYAPENSPMATPPVNPYRWTFNVVPINETWEIKMATESKLSYKDYGKCTMNYMVSSKVYIDTTSIPTRLY